MDDLIPQLRRDHGAIMYYFGQVHQFGLNSPTGSQAFKTGLSLLADHLKREDELFYPLCKKLAVPDSAIDKLLQESISDMDLSSIRNGFSTLLEQLEHANQWALLDDTFVALERKLLSRIYREENVLFKQCTTLLVQLAIQERAQARSTPPLH